MTVSALKMMSTERPLKTLSKLRPLRILRTEETLKTVMTSKDLGTLKSAVKAMMTRIRMPNDYIIEQPKHCHRCVSDVSSSGFLFLPESFNEFLRLLLLLFFCEDGLPPTMES